jgi:flagellar biosynthesis protein FliR
VNSSVDFANHILTRLDLMWTFILLLTRFGGFFFIVPGLGEGAKGLTIRIPAVMVLAFVTMQSSPAAPVPEDIALITVALGFEFLLGMFIGIIPLILVTGVQMGAQLASTSMGFGANQLFDPTTGGSVADLARVFGDLTVILFLLLGGDHVVLHAVSGFGGSLVPGSFVIGEQSVELLIKRIGDAFKVGILISSPVVVALLLTQFVMGLLSRAVPTVNIFIISFPLTIGIGMFITVIALPDIMQFVIREFSGFDNIMLAISKDALMKP